MMLHKEGMFQQPFYRVGPNSLVSLSGILIRWEKRKLAENGPCCSKPLTHVCICIPGLPEISFREVDEPEEYEMYLALFANAPKLASLFVPGVPRDRTPKEL